MDIMDWWLAEVKGGWSAPLRVERGIIMEASPIIPRRWIGRPLWLFARWTQCTLKAHGSVLECVAACE